MGTHQTHIILAYQPVKLSSAAKGLVWAQKSWYFTNKGIFHNPRTIFYHQLTTLLKKWRWSGKEIILFRDINEHIYEERLAKHFAEDDILPKEQVKLCTGHHAPYSHIRGSIPVTATWAIRGIKCLNIFLSRHGDGIGDHWFHVANFCSALVLGLNYPQSICPDG